MSNIKIAKREAEPIREIEDSSSTSEFVLEEKRSGVWKQHLHSTVITTTASLKNGKIFLQQKKEERIKTDPRPSVPHGSEHYYLNVWASKGMFFLGTVHCGLGVSDRFPKRFNYTGRCANVGSSFREHFNCRGFADNTDYHDSWDAEIHIIIRGVDGYGYSYDSDYLRTFAKKNSLEFHNMDLEDHSTTYVNCKLQQLWDYDELKKD